MSRPLTGQREVMRRLQERNEARRVRANEVRDMGGLEPLPNNNPDINFIARDEPMGVPLTTYRGDELESYLRDVAGFQSTDYQRALLEGLQEPGINLVASRSNPGRRRMSPRDFGIYGGRQSGRSFSALQSAAYGYISGIPVMYFDTEANLNRNTYDGYGVARNLRGIRSSFSAFDDDMNDMWDNLYKEYAEKLNDGMMDYHMGRITREEYEKRKKLKSLEDKENANNSDYKFVLEAEY